MMGIASLKSRLRDIPGSERLTMQVLTGRQVYSLNGKIIALDQNATEQQAEEAIRESMASPAIAQITPAAPSSALIPTVNPAPSQPSQKGNQMTGSFSASLKAIVEEARADLERARADGTAKIKDAVGKMVEAKTATLHVTGQMAKTINDEADSMLSELGQLSNDLTGESNG